MGWDILLFDLDGTLTDSGPGIMHAAKTALQSFGIDGLSEQELRYFVGPPLWESFGKYLPEEQISAAIDRFREYYRVTGWLENEPYPGVRECLQALQGALSGAGFNCLIPRPLQVDYHKAADIDFILQNQYFLH